MKASGPLVIIGHNMAMIRFVEAIADFARDRFPIVVISGNPFSAHSQQVLSPLLIEEAGPPLKSADLTSAANMRGIAHIHGSEVEAIIPAEHSIRFQNGYCFSYSKLILATGSAPRYLPGDRLPGVNFFQSMAQAKSLLCGVQPGQKVLILGSGFFAVEAASVSADAGADVTILDEAPWLLHRQIDRAAGLLLEKTLESNGIKVLLKASPAAVLGSDHAEGLLLTDGSRIDAEHIICAGERRPNTTLAQKAGLSVNQGIIVDDGLTTSNPDIYALGDCTEHCGIADGLIETAYAQAEVLARRLTFEPEAAFKGPLRCTNLKVAGIPIFSAGDFIGREECLVWSDTAGGNYKKLVITEGKLSGVMLYGDTSEWHTYLELIRSQTIISPLWNGIALACFGKAKNLAV